MPPSSEPSAFEKSLFDDYRARCEAGTAVDFVALCNSHPAQAVALRKLFDEWEQARLAEPPRTVTVDVGLTAPTGAGAVSAAPGAASTSLLSRLSNQPRRAGTYRFDGEIARGGMGAILKVWDENLRRHLAMKVILGESANSAPDGLTLARFLEEAQVTGQLDHPGIVPVHELGLDSEGRIFFTMKLVKGRDLKRIFELVHADHEGWNETRALSAILKVCEAMAFAHAKGVIHRDLKPANIMIGNYGEVFVMDWGLARVLGQKDNHDIRIRPEFTAGLTSLRTEQRDAREEAADSPILTMGGDVMGTPAYMPPEQALGEVEKLSPRSDVYAIGAMLYHLLARHMPYVPAGARMTGRTILSMVVHGPPTPLSKERKDLPAELVAICEKAMARDAADRYPDTLALGEDLRAYLERRVVSAYETGAAAELRKWITRNKPLAAALAGAIVILVAGVVTSMTFAASATERATALGRANGDLAVAKNSAESNERIARERADDVLSLSASKDLEDLVDRSEELWPADPAHLAQDELWLTEARTLVGGRAADPAHGIKSKPGLADHKAKLAELRARALPLTDEERVREVATHPRATELSDKRGRLVWLSHMLGKPVPSGVSSPNPQGTAPKDPTELDSLARTLVTPDRVVFGQEARGLELVQGALAASKPNAPLKQRETLAWALFANGRLDDALAAAKALASESTGADHQAEVTFKQTLETAVAEWRASRNARDKDWTTLADEVPALERLVLERHTWKFAQSEDEWWHVQLSRLVQQLEAFSDPRTGVLSSGISKEHGWGVEKRVEFARTIEARTLRSPEAASKWTEACASIADASVCPIYGGLVIAPQLGLLPIGRDPDSGLWEFAHLQSGEPAVRGADGKLLLTEETGLVFVLVPGGKFQMGAQSTNPDGDRFDAHALGDESPVRAVELDAWFMSKYEMTQGQWQHFSGANPSQLNPSTYKLKFNADGRWADLLHPVELVSWNDCNRVLSRQGLRLPTEAQWERAARANTDTPWWTGADVASLAGAANLSDNYTVGHGAVWPAYEPKLDDGNTMHAAVGGYRANPFGLHDVIGNVFEWCLDGFGTYDKPVHPGDGEREVFNPPFHAYRGGTFLNLPNDARSTRRSSNPVDYKHVTLGVRPARLVTH